MTDITITTHSSRFHADDVFGVATLMLLLDDGKTGIEVVRSREQEDVDRGDYVLDVGGVYDPLKKKFDHHQQGGAGVRDNGIPYASFGLIWKEYGAKLCGSKEASDIVEQKLVIPVDAMDNGVKIYENLFEDVYPYLFESIVGIFGATWKEDDIEEFHYDNMFKKVLAIAMPILEREIMHARAYVEAVPLVEKVYADAEDKRILVLDHNYPYQSVIAKYPEPLYVIRARADDNMWSIGAVKDNPMSFENRKDFPQEWGGLRDEELARVTGVDDAVFCHRALFMAVAKSREGAIKLAQIASDV